MSQNVVVEETFDNNELGWTENSKPDLGECIIMDGEFKFDSKINSCFIGQLSKRPSLLTSEAEMPIDPNLGFEISADISFDHVRSFLGIPMDNLNMTSGFLLEYDDDFNFIAVAVNESYCFILFYVNGELTRYKYSAVKMKNIDKNKVLANLKIVYRNYKLTVLVDNVEMAELRKVNIESPSIALFATGKRQVNFDNVIISQ
jgi:hypothetical protein